MGLHFHHCHLQIRNIEESLTFFCEQLGLREQNRIVIDSAGLTLLYLVAPDDISDSDKATVLELAYHHNSKHDNSPPTDGSRFAHIAFGVDDLDDFCQRLAQQGVHILQAPVDNQYAYIQSPDGLVVELLQTKQTRKG